MVVLVIDAATVGVEETFTVIVEAPSHKPKHVTLVIVLVTIGVELTLIVNVFGVLLQLPLLPVTVYIVVEVGDNTLEFPEPEGNQV